MKKSIIGGIVALSLILTGTGYAYWTDTLNVTTKATTGELDVTFVDLGLYAQYESEMLNDGWSIVDGIERSDNNGFIPDEFFERGTTDHNIIAADGSIEAYKEEAKLYNNIDFDAELDEAKEIGKAFTTGENLKVVYDSSTLGSDRINITIDNMYPGYAQAFRSDILNLGTLAARLSAIKFSVEEMKDRELDKNMLGIAVLLDRESYDPAEKDSDVFKLCSLFANDGNYFTLGGVDFLRLSALENIDDELIRELENNLLLSQPGSDNRLDIFLAIGMDPDAEGIYTTGSTAVMENNTNDDSASQNNGAVITIDLLWDQFNEGVDAGNPNWLANQNADR